MDNLWCPLVPEKSVCRVAGHIPGQFFVEVYGGCVKTSGANISQESFHWGLSRHRIVGMDHPVSSNIPIIECGWLSSDRKLRWGVPVSQGTGLGLTCIRSTVSTLWSSNKKLWNTIFLNVNQINPVIPSGYLTVCRGQSPPIFKNRKPSISIRAIYTMANC